MRKLLVVIFAISFSGIAFAQEDVTYRPGAVTANWMAIASDLGVTAAQICLVDCTHTVIVDDYLNPANHVGCAAAAIPPTITRGTISNPLGAGDTCYRAVAVTASGAVSEPSPNTATVQDLPLPPTFIK